jgi:polyprenyl P-hydroxybenzoate/phenylacrylic acid decarboxylase-like protein
MAAVMPRRLVLAITGASGAVHGLRLAQVLHAMPGIELHLVVSPSGWRTVGHELGMTRSDFTPLAHQLHDAADVGASIASGSFRFDGMVIAPCSMNTLAAVAHGLADNLIRRAADVALKERRRLVLMVRESPLHLGHLRNMTTATELGAIVCPPMGAFYNWPRTIEELVDQSVSRVLDLLNVPHELGVRWSGMETAGAAAP